MSKKIIYLILGLAVLVRLIGINQSMWLDETISANVVKNYSIFEIPTKFSISDFHPPLYYIVLTLWAKVFGFSEIALRAMSILFGVITVWIIYRTALILTSKNNAIWAAVFTAFNPLLIYYSQEIRMYSMMVMLLMGAFYFYIKIDKENNIKNNVFYNLFCFLAFLTFYGSIFFIATLAIIRLFKKEWKKLFFQNIGIILAIFLVFPLLTKQMILSKQMLIEVKNWSSVLGKVDIKNLVLIPIKFTSGRISFYPKQIYFASAGLWAILIFLTVTLTSWKNKKLGIIFYGPLILGLIFSVFSPLMQYFRFQYLIPIMAIILSIGVKNKSIKFLYLGIFLIFSSIYLFNKNMWREDWKSVSSELGNKVYMISSFSDPIKFYNSKTEIVDIRKIDKNEKNISVIPYGEAIHGVDHNQILSSEGYKMSGQKNFRGMVLETWIK